MKIAQPFDYPCYISKIRHETVVEQFKRLSERLERVLQDVYTPNEGVDKGKLKETLREANKSFSGWRGL